MKGLVVISIILAGGLANALSYSPVRVSGTHTVLASEELVLCSGSGYNVTLPACSNSNDGETHILKDTSTSSNTVTIKPNGTDTIESASGLAFAGSQANQLTCDGSNHNWVGIGYW